MQNAVLAHIHITPTGQSGPVRLNLCGTGAPQMACTPAITFDPLLSAMRTGGAYVNVHTNAAGCTPGDPDCNPGGEIRGQVAN